MAKEAATIELIWDLMRGRTDDISRVEYFPQKPAIYPQHVIFLWINNTFEGIRKHRRPARQRFC